MIEARLGLWLMGASEHFLRNVGSKLLKEANQNSVTETSREDPNWMIANMFLDTANKLKLLKSDLEKSTTPQP